MKHYGVNAMRTIQIEMPKNSEIPISLIFAVNLLRILQAKDLLDFTILFLNSLALAVVFFAYRK